MTTEKRFEHSLSSEGAKYKPLTQISLSSNYDNDDSFPAVSLDQTNDAEEVIVIMRVNEEPLTLQNLTTILSALTELSTKYWLISEGRFYDLIEYTQTHNPRFAEEADVTIENITHNSPWNIDVKFGATDVAQAVVTTLDGIKQADERLIKEKLANQTALQKIKQAEQEAAHTHQMAEIEREQKRLEIEAQRLKLLEQQLDLQKKSVEVALDLAGKIVDSLHPTTDQSARTMMMRIVLPNILQLQNVKGLELILPAPPSDQTPPPPDEK